MGAYDAYMYMHVHVSLVGKGLTGLVYIGTVESVVYTYVQKS